ncbi:Lycopene beta-cyclase (modular protein) [Candidatus Promineifilum breve]|uniref:Lycopene beta-cyclase (Modular protein) n=1 Tax=Candidatus Promineifilum breve TaxID=1806508 RepID=A0A160SZB6_9CHLR|nr:lycopene cyclase domain-containing protein [Candidatus Promineifilum breve]CUS02911.2 Lycopene beta-cyclase (modular protein) [Candidatus Promineifilum breve]
MTYFGFLLRFLVIPILILAGVTLWNERRGRNRAPSLRGTSVWLAIGLHMLIALLYTTPWDNYLVATGVWWYDPALVTGIVLGWVPIEEYTFFVLQPILVGLWLVLLSQHLEFRPEPLRANLRWLAPLLAGVLWLASVVVLLTGKQPATYMALLLGWSLPPIMLQLAFGADILWRYRRIVFLSIVPVTLYLITADALAIHAGTWTIDPAQSFGIFLGGVLPIEEFAFFLMTNVLLTSGMVLLWAEESHERLGEYWRWLRARFSRNEPAGMPVADSLKNQVKG